MRNAKPTAVMFGQVINSDPLEILVEQRLTLNQDQLILTRNVTDFQVDVELEWGTSYSLGKHNMGETIRQTIEAYLLELRQNWKNSKSGVSTIVRISQIETRLLNLSGVLDIGQTTINGVDKNLIIGGNDLPVLGAVTHA